MKHWKTYTNIYTSIYYISFKKCNYITILYIIYPLMCLYINGRTVVPQYMSYQPIVSNCSHNIKGFSTSAQSILRAPFFTVRSASDFLLTATSQISGDTCKYFWREVCRLVWSFAPNGSPFSLTLHFFIWIVVVVFYHFLYTRASWSSPGSSPFNVAFFL